MIDRDQLRIALAWWDSDFDTQDDGLEIQHLVEAARLVANPTTLIVEKTNEMWPFHAVECVVQWEIERRVNPDLTIGDLFEGLRLLAQQGTTK